MLKINSILREDQQWEIGFNALTVRSILSLNTLLQISSIYLLFQKDIKEYFKV